MPPSGVELDRLVQRQQVGLMGWIVSQKVGEMPPVVGVAITGRHPVGVADAGVTREQPVPLFTVELLPQLVELLGVFGSGPAVMASSSALDLGGSGIGSVPVAVLIASASSSSTAAACAKIVSSRS